MTSPPASAPSYQQIPGPAVVVAAPPPALFVSPFPPIAFSFLLRCHHQNKFLSLSSHLELHYSDSATTVWHASPSPQSEPNNPSFLLWTPVSSPLLSSACACFIRCRSDDHYRLHPHLNNAMSNASLFSQLTFFIVQSSHLHSPLQSLRSAASSSFVSFESSGPIADRPNAQSWEMCSLVAPSHPQPMNVPMPLSMTCPALSMYRPMTFVLMSRRYHKYGRQRGSHVKWVRCRHRATMWTCVPRGGEGVAIVGDGGMEWKTGHQQRIVMAHSNTGDVYHVVNKDHDYVALRCVRTGHYVVALCIGMVANRQKPKAWEHFQMQDIKFL